MLEKDKHIGSAETFLKERLTDIEYAPVPGAFDRFENKLALSHPSFPKQLAKAIRNSVIAKVSIISNVMFVAAMGTVLTVSEFDFSTFQTKKKQPTKPSTKAISPAMQEDTLTNVQKTEPELDTIEENTTIENNPLRTKTFPQPKKKIEPLLKNEEKNSLTNEDTLTPLTDSQTQKKALLFEGKNTEETRENIEPLNEQSIIEQYLEQQEKHEKIEKTDSTMRLFKKQKE